MRIALVGGGGSRTPVLYRGLMERVATLGDVELVLHDLSAARLERIGKVFTGMDEAGGNGVSVSSTTVLDDALEGADFVLTAVRAGGFEARRLDEEIAISHGVLGQETVGPGGFALALRNVPALATVAEAVERCCPEAWVINLTNPAGIVTRSLIARLGGRVVGVCDSPTALGRGVTAALDLDAAEAAGIHLEYAGLNHLGWLTAVWHEGRDLLPELLASERLAEVEEARLAGVGEVRALGAIPNEYVYFYEHTAQAVTNMTRQNRARGAFLLAQQRDLASELDAATAPDAALAAYEASLGRRHDSYMALEAGLERSPSTDVFASTGGYHEMALSVVEAVACDRPVVLIVNTANRGALSFLDADDVVEVPAVVGQAGVFPLVSEVPPPKRALVQQVRDFERETLAAIATGSRERALSALSRHPLVPGEAAAAILDGYASRIDGVGQAIGVSA